MATLFVTITLAICAGLSGLAIKEPAIFARLHPPLKYSMMALYAVGTVYTLSVHFTYIQIYPLLAENQRIAGRSAIDAIVLPAEWYVPASFLAWAFVTFLNWVAKQKLQESDKREGSEAS